jgi:hypothetical protein
VDIWYIKNALAGIINEYSDLDVICNARCESGIYDLAPKPANRRNMPPKHDQHLSVQDNFAIFTTKIGNYYISVHNILINIFGIIEVLTYVTSIEKISS